MGWAGCTVKGATHSQVVGFNTNVVFNACVCVYVWACVGVCMFALGPPARGDSSAGQLYPLNPSPLLSTPSPTLC